MSKINIVCLLLVGMFVAGLCCSQQVFAEDEETGNNLSLPVIWSDGVEKVLRGTPGMINDNETPDDITDDFWEPGMMDDNETPDDITDDFWVPWVPGATTNGDFWMLWYTADDEGDLTVENVCHPVDGVCPLDPPHVIPDVAVPVYPQRDPNNTWQAQSLLLDPAVDPDVDVDFVDWGDNLEAKNWYYKAIIRTETILHQDLSTDPEAASFVPMTGYEMIWLEGLGVGEVHGTTLNTYESDDATVYTGCARLTIQGLSVDPYEIVTVPVLDPNGEPVPVLGSNGEPKVDDNGDIIYEEYDARLPILNSDLGLTWNATTSEWEGDVIVNDIVNDEEVPYFQSVVWDATGSQDYEVYSAEINVKGKVIYGYNWDTGKLSDGPGYYRITFSMDNSNPAIQLNTVFDTTEVLLTEEVDGGDEANNETGGGVAVIDYDSNLTYIDVVLLQKKGGEGEGEGDGNSGDGGGEGDGNKPDPDPEPE